MKIEYIALAFVVNKEGRFYVSECPDLGVSSFGTSEEEALKNLGEAAEVYLNTLEEFGEAHKVLDEKGIKVYAYEPSSLEVPRRTKFPVNSRIIPSWQFPHSAK